MDTYQQTGGQLTLLPTFGSEPLDGHENLQDARNLGLTTKYPNLEPIFSAVVNGNDSPFTEGLKHYSGSSV